MIQPVSKANPLAGSSSTDRQGCLGLEVGADVAVPRWSWETPGRHGVLDGHLRAGVLWAQ